MRTKENQRRLISIPKWQAHFAIVFFIAFIWAFISFERFVPDDRTRLYQIIFFTVKWFFLCLGGLSILFFVKTFVETKFDRFLKRIERNMKDMIENVPHTIYFRKKSFYPWHIEHLNEMIEHLCVETVELEKVLNDVREEINKGLEQNDYSRVKDLTVLLKQKLESSRND